MQSRTRSPGLGPDSQPSGLQRRHRESDSTFPMCVAGIGAPPPASLLEGVTVMSLQLPIKTFSLFTTPRQPGEFQTLLLNFYLFGTHWAEPLK